MRKKPRKIANRDLLSALLIISILLMSTLDVSTRIQAVTAEGEPTAIVRFIPDLIEVDAVGEEFIVACIVENGYNLSGFDIRFSWSTIYLDYLNHTVTVPIETYPTPQTPSPYGGLLHSPLLQLRDEVNETAGTYWAAFATLGTQSFNGNGTAFVMNFKVKNSSYGDPSEYLVTYLNFTIVELARSISAGGGPLSYTSESGVVKIRYLEFGYPPWPLLKILPSHITGIWECNNFTIDVYLMGDGNIDLSSFWDVAGIDVFVNFNTTLIEAITTTIDPDGWFAAYWPSIMILADEINNTAGAVHVAFVGYGENHTAPSGQGRLFSITFHSIFESEVSPTPSEAIYLENPVTYTGACNYDSINGLISIDAPVGTIWHELTPTFCDGPFELTDWKDNGDGVLSPSDQLRLNHTGTGFYFDYHLDGITGTLNLTQQSYEVIDDYVWAASFGEDGLDNNGLPGRYVGTDDPYNGFGVPDWTGNFSLTQPFVSVSSINVTALPFTPDNYTYTLIEGVDYIVHTIDNLIELLTPVDVPIIGEHWVDGVNNSLQGWASINYVASGIESVWVDMNNGTARFGRNWGYAAPPPSEWWYEPDWPWELEFWFACGQPIWPAGSEWWVNYTAASYLTVEYSAELDSNPRYINFTGSYTDFLALNDPISSTWSEIYPQSWRTYTVVGWNDGDASGNITSGDYIDVVETAGYRTYLVNSVSTDISVQRKPWIVESSPDDVFFGVKPIVTVVGSPHPERAFSPWHNLQYSVLLPHKVENATYTASLTQQPPMATYTFSPTAPMEFEPTIFNASGSYDPDGYIVNYVWDFDDGSPPVVTTETTLIHNFTLQGTYNVTLTITDDSALTDTYWELVQVQPLAGARIYVKPPEIIDPTLTPGGQFSIDIQMENVTRLYGYMFHLSYDTDVLTALGVIILPPTNDTHFAAEISVIDEIGEIVINVTYSPPAESITILTNTTVVTIYFQVQSCGHTPLNLHTTELVNKLGEPIPHDVEDGFFCIPGDVAIISVEPSQSMVYPGRIVDITVVVSNLGNTIETFNVATYYNGNPIETQPVLNLPPHQNATLVFNWKTKGLPPCSNFTISAEATPVPYELDVDNNRRNDAFVKTKILGDVNGDGTVDIFDVVTAVKAYRSHEGDPNWNPEADLVPVYGLVDIYDLVIIAGNYKTSC